MYYYVNSYDIWPFGHKVTFDGVTKRIYVNNGESFLRVKEDLYSAWKEWSSLRDYAKFLPAFRSIGGDPIDIAKGIYAGDIYFLMNGWQIVIDQSVSVQGTLYHDDAINPYIILPGGGVSATVSNLVQTVAGNASYTPTEIRQEIDTNSTKLIESINKLNTIIASISTLPSAAQVATAVRAELTAELAHLVSLQNGLTLGESTMLVEMYTLLGLDPTQPLVVTDTQRTAGTLIKQQVSISPAQTSVTRVD